jgi:ArsR family transcriptional regulator
MHRHAMVNDRPPTQLLMACLGDASRFRLVQALINGPRCVTELAVEVGLSQSCTTRHLQALERRNVVMGSRDGKRVLYRLCAEDPGLRALLSWALPPEPGAGAFGRPARPNPKESRRRHLEETAEALIRFAAASVGREREPAVLSRAGVGTVRTPAPGVSVPRGSIGVAPGAGRSGRVAAAEPEAASKPEGNEAAETPVDRAKHEEITGDREAGRAAWRQPRTDLEDYLL